MTSLHTKQLHGTLLVTLSGLLYGFLGYLGTQLLRAEFTVENMLFWRFLFATLWMLIPTLILKKSSSEKKHAHSVLLKIVIFSTLTYSGATAFYFLGTRYIGTGISMVIFFSYPIFVTLFAWLLGQWRMNKIALLSLCIVLIGLICLKGQGQHTLNLLGLLFAILSALFYAAYVYGSHHLGKNIEANLMTLLVCIGNTAIFFVLSSFTHSLYWPTTLSTVGYALALGILATAIPIQLLLKGMQYISPVKASILSVLEPVVTVLIGVLLLAEAISPLQWLGMMIMLAGAITIQFESLPSEKPDQVYR